ncbi:MAG TPA: hypothetical protein VM223_05645 [Planctomycetota bacterium]|nr:hypothetical protein [Planctomycetota bacterium]
MKHYQRFLRHGNPYEVRKAKCVACLGLIKILNRPGASPEALLEKYADILLLVMTGSPYRLRDQDAEGREYELDLKEVPSGD